MPDQAEKDGVLWQRFDESTTLEEIAQVCILEVSPYKRFDCNLCDLCDKVKADYLLVSKELTEVAADQSVASFGTDRSIPG